MIPSTTNRFGAAGSRFRRWDVIGGIGLISAVLCASLLLASEQIGWLSVLLGFAAVVLLAHGWARIHARRVLIICADLAVVFVYTWSLGAPSGIRVVIVQNAHGLTATVDGNSFHQSGHVERLGLLASARRQYVTTSDGGRQLTDGSAFALLANTTRFAVPAPAWTGITLQTAGHVDQTFTSIQPAHGSWTRNPRGELEGSPGALGWFSATPAELTKGFTFAATLMRPDGTQGIVLADPTGRYGYLLAIRMDHRDARFYYWNRGQVGLCTCSHPPTFPVQFTPMAQRVLRYFLPSLILGMTLVLLAWAVFAILRAITLLTTGSNPLRVTAWQPQVPSRHDVRIQIRSGVSAMETAFLIAAGVVAAVGTVLAMRIALINNQTLPTIEDTSTYIFQAKTFALGRLWNTIPHPFRSFSLPFTIASDGHWFGKYPPGWPALLAIGAMFDKAWIITPLVGGVSLLLIFLIGRELFSPWVGLAGALFALSSPFFLSMAGSLLSQSAEWMWCGLFCYLVLLWFRRTSFGGRIDIGFSTDRWPLLVGAGLAIGIAFTTRQLDAVTVTLPFICLLLRRPLTLALVAAGSVIPIGLMALYNIAVTGNPMGGGYGQAEPWDHYWFGAGGPTAYERGFDAARALWNIAYDLEHLQIGLFGWPFFVALALVAVPFVAGRANRWDWLLVSSSLVVVAAYGGYWASGVTGEFPRYWFAIVPWLCLLAARGLEQFIAWPTQTFRDRSGYVAALPFPVAFIAVMTVFNIHYFMPTNVTDYVNPNGPVVAAVKAQHIHHALIFQRQHNSQDSEWEVIFSQNSPSLDGDILWAIDLGPKKDRLAAEAHPGRAYYLMNQPSSCAPGVDAGCLHITRLHFP
jgi:hypothetical protein